MGKMKRAYAVGDKAAELGYRLQRELLFWGNFSYGLAQATSQSR